jgi:hypothetical protein
MQLKKRLLNKTKNVSMNEKQNGGGGGCGVGGQAYLSHRLISVLLPLLAITVAEV